MQKTNKQRIQPQTSADAAGSGTCGGKGLPPTLPPVLPRRGYVVWFYAHDEFLGYAWNEEEREIRRARVSDPDHAIYFDTFAQAMIATETLLSPYRILYSPQMGSAPRLVR